MLELYIIRHGLAGKSLEVESEDEERPLTKKGKEMMKDISKGLKKHKIRFDIVVSSPLIRSVESADIIREHCGGSKKVIVSDLLKPDSSFTNLIKFLNKFKGKERVAIIGHEPFLSSFASYCLTKNKNALLHFKKGGVLMLEIDKAIKPGHCLLSWLMEPRQIIVK